MYVIFCLQLYTDAHHSACSYVKQTTRLILVVIYIRASDHVSPRSLSITMVKVKGNYMMMLLQNRIFIGKHVYICN